MFLKVPLKTSSRRSYLITLLILLISTVSFAQQDKRQKNIFERNLHFHLIDDSSGLSNNFINDITQDSLGYIWISTFDGLNKYDGTNFIQFKDYFETETKGLSNNFVKELKLLGHSELLIATDNGLDIYNFKDDTFRVINTENGLIHNSVSALELDDRFNVFIGTFEGGIQVADTDWKLKELLNQSNLSSKEISSLTTQNDSILWVGTFNNGINKINLNTHRVTSLGFGPNTNFPSGIINKLYTDSQNNVWVGSRDGLQLITNQGEVLQLYKANTPISGLSDSDILCFEEDGKGNMWIGTRNGGLNILETNTLTDENRSLNLRWFLPNTDGSSVYNRTVSAILQDKGNNMWLGTPTGINYVSPDGEPVTLIKRNQVKQNSISHNRIGAIATTKNNQIWIGTDGNGLDLYDPIKGVVKSFKHIKNNPNSLSNNYILSLLEDSQDNLWVGTYRGGIHKISKDHNKITRYLGNSLEKGSDVRVIFESDTKDIWVGTNRGGLYKYNRNTDSFSYIEQLGKIDVRSIDADKNGILWLATYGSGIIKYNPKKQSSTVFNTDNTPGLTSDVIFSILVLNENDILCGTRYGGLVRMNQQGLVKKRFTASDGLSNNTICSLVKENNTYIWMSTYNGISRYNVQNDEILDFSSLNNIQNGEFNIGAVAIRDSTTIYFGGNNGMNVIKTDVFKQSQVKPQLLFNQLTVLNQKVKVSNDKGSILNMAMSFTDKITLKHDQNSFSIGFTALKYPEAKKVSYAYKLENYNDYWVDTKGVGIANFNNVPPGDYILKVRMNSGLDSPVFKSLSISILPPFWKTIWAYLLYIVVGSLLLWIILTYYAERVRLKNSLLFEKKQRQLEHELNQERLRFFTAFSHELKTALTLVIAPIENMLIKEKRGKFKDRLLFVHKNGRKLSQSINQLLEFRKSENGLSTLNISKHDVSKVLSKWVERYKGLAKSKNIHLSLSIDDNGDSSYVDIEKIEIIINNLLSNAINYCNKAGQVHVGYSSNQTDFKIQVSDTGIGIAEEEFEHIFNWYYRSDSTLKKSGTGIGLALSKKFAELHRGEISLQSIPNIKTTFTLVVPHSTMSSPSIIQDDYETINQNLKDTIPLTPIDPNPTWDTDVSPSVNSKPLILIVDDNPDILYFLNDICKDEFKVLMAKDGLEGIQKAGEFIPDLIISDVMMPEKDGIDLCSSIKSQASTSHIPVILLTAKNTVEGIALGYNQGADDYITKPFHPQLLIIRIKNLLNSRAQLREYFLNKTIPISNSLDKKESQLVEREKQFLLKLDQVIKANVNSEKDSAEDIATTMGMSRISLYRKLKAITGLSINQYMRNFKIEMAADLIKNEGLTISQASYEVGFSNIKYFRKIFKEKYGVNPSELRKQHL